MLAVVMPHRCPGVGHDHFGTGNRFARIIESHHLCVTCRRCGKHHPIGLIAIGAANLELEMHQ